MATTGDSMAARWVSVIKGSARAVEARRFVAFVVSPQGQAILRRHGFGAP